MEAATQFEEQNIKQTVLYRDFILFNPTETRLVWDNTTTDGTDGSCCCKHPLNREGNSESIIQYVSNVLTACFAMNEHCDFVTIVFCSRVVQKRSEVWQKEKRSARELK